MIVYFFGFIHLFMPSVDIMDGGHSYSAVFDCSANTSDVSPHSWIGYVLQDRGVVISFNSPETALKDATTPIATLFARV